MSNRHPKIDLTPELLIEAYSQGIFPMADTAASKTVNWVRPRERGAMLVDQARVPKNLRKFVRNMPYTMTVSQDFRAVMLACAEPRQDQEETWINAQILEAYCEMQALGLAQSIEVWSQEGALIGGLYGIHLGGAFFGESMFSRATNTSKAAMVGLLASLDASGIELLDTQFWTPHLSQFGVYEMSDGQFQHHLAEALNNKRSFKPALAQDALSEFIKKTLD